MNKKSVTILGISIWKLFAYFIIYSFIGYIIETLFGIATKGVWESRQSFLYGPFCGIYGIGAITITLLSRYFNKNKLTLFVGGFLVGSVTEYTISFLVDTILHTKWWDYSNMPLNLNGYVCLLFSLIWGVFCVFIVDVFHPLIDTLLSHIPFLVGIILVCILVIAGLADLYVTASGILKLNKRLEKCRPLQTNFIRFPTSLVNQSTSVPLQLWKNRKSSKILYLRSRKNLNLLFPKNRKQFQTPLPMFLTK